MEHTYTAEEISEVNQRVEKGLQALKDLELLPACFVQKKSLMVEGDKGKEEVFVDKISAYLQDTKYNKPQVSTAETPVIKDAEIQEGAIPSTDKEVNPLA